MAPYLIYTRLTVRCLYVICIVSSTSHGDASEDSVESTLPHIFHPLGLLTVDACAAAPALEIDLRLNDVLLDAIQN